MTVPPTTNEYKPPILSSVFSVLGVLALIGSFFCLFVSISTAVMVGLTGIIYFGIAQVIDYLGRTAHSTDRLCTMMETSVLHQLKSIESRLSSRTPLLVRTESTPATPPPQATRPGAVFHFATDGSKQGPFTAADMRDFHSAAAITDTTPVFREGEAQWRTYRDFPEFSS